jgi:PIN domain nuclease of toxin-antitoxin system
VGSVPLIVGLLDTHVLLWHLSGDRRLPLHLATEIDRDPSLFGVSDVCLWEVAIKIATGRLQAPDDLPNVVVEAGFQAVPIATRHVWTVRDLPFHHRDPFDRLLVAQSIDLGVPVVTSDPAFAVYDVAVRW